MTQKKENRKIEGWNLLLMKNEKKVLAITGVWQYGGNVHIAYRHIAKHRNVIAH